MTRINIKGPIISNGDKWIYELFGMDATCPKDVTDALPTDGSDVVVMVNSGGGYVHIGSEIYTILKQYSGNVTVDIIEACSAASTIAMSGNPTRITPTGKIMIHNVSSYAAGDHKDMEHMGEVLRKADESICAAYELKTGKSKEELLAMMDRETWLTAEEAKEMGFVDEILFQEEKAPKLVANCESLISGKIINEMQSLKPKLDNASQGAPDLDKLADMVADKLAVKLDKQPQGSAPPKSTVQKSLLNKLIREV